MLINIMTSASATSWGNLLMILLLCLPIVFFITLIVGIVKNNKKLWIISLIFLIISVFLDIALNTFNPKPKHITTTTSNFNNKTQTTTTKSNNAIK